MSKIKSVNTRVSKSFYQMLQDIKSQFAEIGVKISDAQASEYIKKTINSGGKYEDKSLLKDFTVIIRKK